MQSSRVVRFAFLALGVSAGALVASPARAELIVGLTSTAQLVRFDHMAPGVILSTSPIISGLNAGDSVVDIDYYPVTQSLHGIGTSGVLYRIDPITGAATLDVTPQSAIDRPRAIDFNPMADRLRVFAANSQNFRLTPSVNTAGPTGANAGLVTADGTLAYAGGTPTPNLVAAAYTNNFDGTAATTLYSIDADLDALVVHSGAPAFSMLTVVGNLGIDAGNFVGFDVSRLGNNFLTNGNDLYTINLASGAVTPAGTIGGPLGVTTIAVVPAPGAAALGVLGALALVVRRRRN